MSTQDKQQVSVLAAGTQAPDFTLRQTSDKKVSLHDFKGQPVILAFYPADWSSVCGDQLALYNQILPEFQKHKAQLLGISVDNIYSHMAFTKDRKLDFPLLADFEPKGEVSRKYGAYLSDGGTSGRALFVIDSEGVIRWSFLSPNKVNPGADGILNALENLQEKEAAR